MAARFSPVESKAPHLMSDSTTRLLTRRRSTRSQKSKSPPKGPPARASMIASMAPVPTFLTAPRPNRMACSRTRKERSEALMSGGRTWIPMSRQSLMFLMTLSVFPMSSVRSAAMNSTG